jgi:hypothetical protein
VVSVLFALLTALFNGMASVLQRMAAATAPAAEALHLSLFGYLIKRRVRRSAWPPRAATR